MFQCGECGSVREYKSIGELAKKKLLERCKDHESRWTQVDVVYAHWYGTIEPLSPDNYTFKDSTGEIQQITSCTCGWLHFSLKSKAPVFSEWKYVCEGCGTPRDLKKAERHVLQKLKRDSLKPGGRSFEWIEIDMLPVSYRASSAFYPQRASFIALRETKVVELMRPTRQDELLRRLAEIHSIPYQEPSDSEIQEILLKAGRQDEWDDYSVTRRMYLRQPEGTSVRTDFGNAMTKQREKWFDDGLLERGKLESDAISVAVGVRQN